MAAPTTSRATSPSWELVQGAWRPVVACYDAPTFHVTRAALLKEIAAFTEMGKNAALSHISVPARGPNVQQKLQKLVCTELKKVAPAKQHQRRRQQPNVHQKLQKMLVCKELRISHDAESDWYLVPSLPPPAPQQQQQQQQQQRAASKAYSSSSNVRQARPTAAALARG